MLCKRQTQKVKLNCKLIPCRIVERFFTLADIPLNTSRTQMLGIHNLHKNGKGLTELQKRFLSNDESKNILYREWEIAHLKWGPPLSLNLKFTLSIELKIKGKRNSRGKAYVGICFCHYENWVEDNLK